MSALQFHTTRPVAPAWTCQRSGECCTQPDEVLMTKEEAVAISFALRKGGFDNLQTEWRVIDERFVALKAHPCPLYAFNTCIIYESRPYNCRRFGCMRPDPKTEPFEMGGELGCKNLEDRVEHSRDARRLAMKMQRKAMRWGREHGWEKATDDTPEPPGRPV